MKKIFDYRLIFWYMQYTLRASWKLESLWLFYSLTVSIFLVRNYHYQPVTIENFEVCLKFRWNFENQWVWKILICNIFRPKADYTTPITQGEGVSFPKELILCDHLGKRGVICNRAKFAMSQNWKTNGRCKHFYGRELPLPTSNYWNFEVCLKLRWNFESRWVGKIFICNISRCSYRI